MHLRRNTEQTVLHIKNMAYWCDKETFKLIELWGEDKIQAQLEGCKRNKEVFAGISRKMEEAGYQKSATQCRDKTN